MKNKIRKTLDVERKIEETKNVCNETNNTKKNTTELTDK
jgi:hypothetical protein